MQNGLYYIYMTFNKLSILMDLGAAENKMFSASYPSQWQDFMANDLTYLDSWVFNYLVDMAKQEKLPKEEGASPKLRDFPLVKFPGLIPLAKANE